MSWFLSEGPRAANKATNIKELKKAFISIKEVKNTADETIFDLLFESARQFCTLKIFLDRDFPNSKPVLQVFGPISNSWLDSHNRVIGCEKLRNWTKNSSLVEVVQECYVKLQKPSGEVNRIDSIGSMSYQRTNSIPSAKPPPYLDANSSQYKQSAFNSAPPEIPPPKVVSNGHSSTTMYILPKPSSAHNAISDFSMLSNSLPASSATNSAQFLSPSQPEDSKQSRQRIPLPEKTVIPPAPREFNEIESMSIDQLRRLQGDSAALHAFVMNHPDAVTFAKKKEFLLQKTVTDAQENLSKYEEYCSLSHEVKKLQMQLKSGVLSYNQRLASRGNTESAVLIKEKLMKRKNEFRDQSDRHLQDFLQGTLQMDDFLKRYLELKTKYHMLDCKLRSCEELQQMG